VPDATGLELIAAEVRDRMGEEAVVDTSYARERATLEVRPDRLHDVLEYLRGEASEPFGDLMSLHGCDYLPDEPRLGVHYELLSKERAERLAVKTRLGADDPRLSTVVDLFPTAEFQEREVYDMFGVRFDGHPDMRRILMPEDYEGFPQRRDFPIGGEPVIFTFNENEIPRWYD
jgi:NADH-quinone oxidoreductase subunit C